MGTILAAGLAVVGFFSGVTVHVSNPQVIETPAVTSVGQREVSSYTVGRVEEADDSPCIGAFGDDLCALAKQGIRTCASNEFKKGTKLVLGDGLDCVVLDRMNERYPTRVDVADLDHEAAVRFGVQTLEVSIRQ